ncbi:MAG TPA: PIN domain-containing protein [Burkholderiales bacterium]|nr:PIN domain-containing protein [Burkholderiales bacterium]
MRLLLDTNVVLDVLANREPQVKESAAVLSAIEAGKAEGLLAAHSVTTLHYLLHKQLGPKKAAAAIADVVSLLRIVPVDHETILLALSLGWRDFEDAVQAAAAIRSKATHIITRNPKDYRDFSLPVMQPGEFLKVVLRLR